MYQFLVIVTYLNAEAHAWFPDRKTQTEAIMMMSMAFKSTMVITRTVMFAVMVLRRIAMMATIMTIVLPVPFEPLVVAMAVPFV